jgi:hypothetical protein
MYPPSSLGDPHVCLCACLCPELTATIRAKPVNYHVSLFDLQLGGSWGYKGLVKVDAKVARPTNEIVLNAKELEVQHAEVLGKDGGCPLHCECDQTS